MSQIHKNIKFKIWDCNNNRKQEKKVGFFMFYPYPEDAWIRICFTVRKCHAVIRMLPGVDMILLTALPAGAPPQCCPPPSRDGRWQLRAAEGAACPSTWLWRRWRGSPWRIWPPPAWAVIPVTNYNFYSTWKKINLWRDAGIEPGRAACARKTTSHVSKPNPL